MHQYVDDYFSSWQGAGIGLAYISVLPHTYFWIFMDSCFFEKLLEMCSIWNRHIKSYFQIFGTLIKWSLENYKHFSPVDFIIGGDLILGYFSKKKKINVFSSHYTLQYWTMAFYRYIDIISFQRLKLNQCRQFYQG